MGMTIEDYEKVLVSLRAAHHRLQEDLIPRIRRMPLYSLPLGDARHDHLTPLLRQLDTLDYQMSLALLSAGAPISFWRRADDWARQRAEGTGISGRLQPTSRPVFGRWRGNAAQYYEAIVATQAGAADRLGLVADRMQLALTWTAEAIAVYYATLLGYLLMAAAEFAAALGAASTVVGAPIAASVLAAAIPKLFGGLTALLAAAAAVLAWGQVFLHNILSDADDLTRFPQGQWPGWVNDSWKDGTATDGDADWSVVPGQLPPAGTS